MSSTGEYICKWRGCRKPFTARTADRARGWALFCSKSCKATEQESRTHQHANYKQRVHDNDHDVAMADNEAGWDGHKNAY